MKKLIYFFLAITLWSCGKKTKGVDSKIYTEKQVSDFIRVNPDWTVADTATTERFKHRMINMSNEPGFLKDFPMQFMGFIDSPMNGTTVKFAVFKSYLDAKREPTSLLNDLILEVAGFVSEDQQSKLKVNAHYYISGGVYKQGKRKDVDMKVEDGANVYLLGKYTFTISDFKLID